MIEIRYKEKHSPTARAKRLCDVIEREIEDPTVVDRKARAIGLLVDKLVTKGVFTLDDARAFVTGQIEEEA